jgi:hypothetical protein
MNRVLSFFICIVITSLSFTQIFEQKNKFVSSNRANYLWYGYSSGISGNYAIAGVRSDNLDENEKNAIAAAGSAVLFEKINGVWTKVQKIVANDRDNNETSNGGSFGESVAIEGDIAVIGSPSDDYNEKGSTQIINGGSVYIFERNQNGIWIQKQKLVASDRGQTDGFGTVVKISGNYLIVGTSADGSDENGLNEISKAGSAYIFEKNQNRLWI